VFSIVGTACGNGRVNSALRSTQLLPEVGTDSLRVKQSTANRSFAMSEYVNEVSDSSFDKDVLQSDRPVLVDFWATWCAPCRMLEPTVAAVAEKYAANARVVKVNVDENPSISQRYGIKGIPTLILFKGGKEAERVVGATSKDAISKMIDKHIAGAAKA
jgi:thioredoxin 1